MRSNTILFGVSQFAASAAAINYKLIDSYTPSNFFSKFDFFTGDDGTGGFANYQTESGATAAGLISTGSSSVKFGADYLHTVSTTSSGRASVRLEGTTNYDKGIIVADIQHMPGNACGAWPAFWSFSNPWPYQGEIDMIEGVNFMTENKASLHTGLGTCVLTDEGSLETGTVAATDCHTLNPTTGKIENTGGCGIDSGKPNSFGTPFNAVNGGYYITQWTDDFIKVWFFERANKPATLDCDVPDVSTLGTPDMYFSGCDFGSRISNQHLVFSTNFCGSWAGAVGVYDQTYALGCPNYNLDTPDLNCRKFVAENPSAFANQYWEVNSIKVYGETTDTVSGACHASSSASVSSAPASSAPASSAPASSAPASSAPASSAPASSAPASSAPASSAPASSAPASSAPVISAPAAVSSSSSSVPPSTSSFASVSARNSSATFNFPSIRPTASSHGNGGHGHGGSITRPVPSASATKSSGTYGSSNKYEGHSTWGSNQPAGCSPVKVPFSTTLTTKIVDVCETGLTTSTLTTTVKYCPMCHENPTSPYWGFTETVKVCSTGCAPSPISVTVTIPWTATPVSGGSWNGNPWNSPAAPATTSAAPGWGVGSWSTSKTTASASPAWGASSGSASAPAAPAWGASSGSSSAAAPAWGASSGSYSAAAAPVWSASAGSSAVAGAYGAKPSGTVSWSLSNGTSTYKPVLASTNGASTTFASVVVMVAAAAAAVFML
ncbi:uncharacterized protein PV09_06700 [Verruconis gallopava]|uniref:endo-1,3(4)-beta-glucanase n=1 Tax=Verruconis gallopava TaxID=253628 RepID=A0A0D1XHW9_9PEZI|nr:uncharacterized protein PV09_06700 [Verruconis gallopava]KIW01851.1 hypothetical protein PV09_06700 [Verruconis gallopava]